MTSSENDRSGELLTVTPRRGIARNTAVVLAGAASIGLTAAAGAYVVHNVPGGLPGGPAAAPAAPAPADPQPPLRSATPRFDAGRPVVTAALFDRRDAAVSGPLAARQETVPATGPAPMAPAAPPATRPEPAFDRTVRVGPAYLGATIGAEEDGVVTVTLGTNATVAALTGRRTGSGSADVMTLRTEIGADGDVTVTFSDPTLGEHDLRLESPQERAVPAEPGPTTT